MESRRNFLKETSLALLSLPIAGKLSSQTTVNHKAFEKPVVISTWSHGVPANAEAFKILKSGGRALDAVEKGVMVPEADPTVTSVGYGGLPDRDGKVTLDASIMDENGNCGSVAFLQNIMHPISVARLVMEKTPHVMLVGKGAEKFAYQNGFKKENLLTEQSKERWQEWMKKSNYKPSKDENHDTIGMLALDSGGNLSGACTTSGLAWKIHGRVGDSPIIGAGMYSDNEIGAACSTGVGEAVIKICGSFLIVELMRQGKSPQQACEEAIRRIARRPLDGEFQVAFLALSKNGEIGAYSYRKGFQFALNYADKALLIDSDYLLK